MPELRMLLIILAIGLLVSVLQIIIWRASKDKAFFKYIPTFVLLIVAVVCLVKAIWFSAGMEDLAYFVISLMAAGIMIISLVAGIVLDLIGRLKK